MATLKFTDVEPRHWREIKAAQRDGVDILIMPADTYALRSHQMELAVCVAMAHTLLGEDYMQHPACQEAAAKYKANQEKLERLNISRRGEGGDDTDLRS